MGERVVVLKVNELPAGRSKTCEAAGRRLLVCNIEGELFAVDDVCTHDGGALGEGQLAGGQIECPRHGARFDVRTGRAMTLPAILPVRTYPVAVEGDDVVVEID